MSVVFLINWNGSGQGCERRYSPVAADSSLMMQQRDVTPASAIRRISLPIIGSPPMGTRAFGVSSPPAARRSPFPAAMIPAFHQTSTSSSDSRVMTASTGVACSGRRGFGPFSQIVFKPNCALGIMSRS